MTPHAEFGSIGHFCAIGVATVIGRAHDLRYRATGVLCLRSMDENICSQNDLSSRGHNQVESRV